MVKLKSKKLAALCCAVALMASFSVPAFAAGHAYKFTFSGSGATNQQASSYWSKFDQEQNAYVSINSANNWTVNYDQVYLWIRASDGTDRTFTNAHFDDYGNYPLPYTTYTDADTNCTLCGWHNNNQHPKTFWVSGNFTP